MNSTPKIPVLPFVFNFIRTSPPPLLLLEPWIKEPAEAEACAVANKVMNKVNSEQGLYLVALPNDAP
jgi:hypothetical protein